MRSTPAYSQKSGAGSVVEDVEEVEEREYWTGEVDVAGEGHDEMFKTDCFEDVIGLGGLDESDVILSDDEDVT